jgi:hypothetical protein
VAEETQRSHRVGLILHSHPLSFSLSPSQESLDDDLLAAKTEQLDRSLAQASVRLLSECERSRRMLESDANDMVESSSRRHNVALAKHLTEQERIDRLAREEAERGEATIENERERKENQLRALEATEQERQAQIATHVRRGSNLTPIAAK